MLVYPSSDNASPAGLFYDALYANLPLVKKARGTANMSYEKYVNESELSTGSNNANTITESSVNTADSNVWL